MPSPKIIFDVAPTCVRCGAGFETYGNWKKYCSDKCRKNTGRPPGTPLKGVQHPNARMAPDSVREMRERYSGGGETYLSLACDYDLALSTVGAILTRRTWRHV